MRATAAPEEGNKVRLTVEIDEAEMDEALDDVLQRLSREVRVPGFRPGKVPRKVLESRMGGRVALRGEAIREALPDFYSRAVDETEVDPIDQPDIDITAGEESGPLSFEAVVEVRPTVAIPGYGGLVVALPALEVDDEEVTAQVDRLRATSGELVEVTRPVLTGDQVTIDIRGTRAEADADGDDSDLTADDFLYEVGSEGVIPGLDDQLLGTKAGDSVTFDAELEALGQTVSFTVTVKDVKELSLPDADDDWASEASEFATLEELRADIAERLRQRRIVEAQMALQQKTVEALVELVTEEVPEQLVLTELRERIHDLNHRLEGQGMSLGQFLGVTGRSEDEFLDELRAQALQSVKADLALRALVEAEDIQVTDEELDEELAAMGSRLEMDADQVRSQLERAGRLAAVRSDRRKAKAMRWLVDSVELVDENGAPVSRDDLKVNQGEEDSE
ncbi:MAG TPA: trigger factor [Acidimicrobiales bacterium]|nr:trigger factor [Acidimicrobiales bacterium]